MDENSAYVTIGSSLAEDISCLCHKTKRENICSIFYQGLMPGGTTGARRHSNLSPYLPHGSRNVAVGRADNSYDTVIMYDKESLFRDGIKLYMSLNGIVATTRTIGFNHIQLVYVVPNGNYYVGSHPCWFHHATQCFQSETVVL